MARPVSYSRARCFDECPAKFQAEYESGGNRPRNEPHLVMGSIVHEVSDRYVQHLKATGQSSDYDEADRIAAEVWNSPERRLALGESDRAQYDALIENMKEMLVFADVSIISASELPLAVSRSWEAVDYHAGQAWVRARLDRVDLTPDGDLRITDYKTGHIIRPIEGDPQLELYAAMSAAAYPGTESVEVELVYLRHRIVKTARLDAAALARGRAWIERLSDAIDRARTADEWPARPGAACRGCSAFQSCEARRRSFKVSPPADEAEAEALIGRLILLERERGEIMEAVRPWVDQFGTIEVNGMALGPDLIARREFDPVQTWRILEARGVRPIDYMRVDSTKIRSLARMDQGLQAALNAVARDKSFTQLKLKVIIP